MRPKQGEPPIRPKVVYLAANVSPAEMPTCPECLGLKCYTTAKEAKQAGDVAIKFIRESEVRPGGK